HSACGVIGLFAAQESLRGAVLQALADERCHFAERAEVARLHLPHALSKPAGDMNVSFRATRGLVEDHQIGLVALGDHALVEAEMLGRYFAIGTAGDLEAELGE